MATIRFLGTGNAFHEDGRGSQCLLVERAPAASFLIDAGPTAAAAISRFEVDLRGIDGLFVTHLHGDHTAGWPFLLLHLALVVRRTRSFDVHGPVGVRVCLEQLTRLCYGDLLERPGFEIRYSEHPVVESLGLVSRLGPTFDLLPMEHHPTSLGFRFQLAEAEGNVRIGVSGDTAWCANLERLARDCDLLILECSSPEPGSGRHISLVELREGIGRLGAERIVLTHLVDAVAERLALDPLPRVTAAYDGMVWQTASVSGNPD